ncbi:GATA transcription factor 9-like [Camellia sinensis]|uniref:GATA transcription factor n=1 Tax=Camellia sinensis var. sinensis TaxID=542762 RepID=A0A4S4DGJ5_CAMSN|nr:GATA transcription factor 9-like [Camellia sinensis]THG01879.1 hypothetical protein TEA_018062 [Camellia sinensis var. sinensis]
MEAPEIFFGGYFSAPGNKDFSPENCFSDHKPFGNNQFTIDDLLDFSKDDQVIMNDAFFDNLPRNSADSSTVMVVDGCNASVSGNESQFSGNFVRRSFTDAQFSGELCVPYDDVAELEWLSNFVDDSFSTDNLQNLQQISTTAKPPTDTSSSETPRDFRPKTSTNRHNPPIFTPDVSVPGKPRSKRSRAAPCDWSSRLLILSPTSEPNETTPSKKRYTAETSGRKCLHCASEKTPQWRAGPMGPKTLCNACGVRYNSGRLVPEYRPAASPTFVSTKHSNSHRKVVELRRQKEQQLLSQSSGFGVSNGQEYLIHHQSGLDYRHMLEY